MAGKKKKGNGALIGVGMIWVSIAGIWKNEHRFDYFKAARDTTAVESVDGLSPGALFAKKARPFLCDTVPKSVTVTAGRDFFKQREHFDSLMCVFQYETPQGSVRAFHQSLSSMDDPEAPLQKFMGTDATIRIAEFEPIIEIRNGSLINDSSSKLSELAKRGIIRPAGKTPSYFKNYPAGTAFGIPSEPTYAPIPYELPGKAPRPALEAHLMNFFDAIHGRAQLNCDARTALQSEAAIYWLHAAAESGETLRFTPEQLAV